jgi:hypothetical protein
VPKNTPVHKLYEALRSEGMDEDKAAAISQARTGMALMTGKPPMHPKSMAMIIAVKKNKSKSKSKSKKK